MSRRRHSAPEHSRTGTFTEIPLDGGAPKVADLVSCCHCGYTSIWVALSATWWGWCGDCAGLLCGREACRGKPCSHWRQKIDNVEAGRPEEYRPIVGLVEAAPPRG